ncbi:MAG: C1 family peptidase [bacterium]
MKSYFFKPLVVLILIILTVGNGVGSIARGEKLNVQTLNELIKGRKKHWVARETSTSNLSMAQKQALCGLLGKRRPFADMQGVEGAEGAEGVQSAEGVQGMQSDYSRGTAIRGAGYLRARSFSQAESYFLVGNASSQRGEDQSAFPEGSGSLTASPAGAGSVTLPSQFDWRSKDKRNWTTPIRNQGSCGSCWAHASIAVMESMKKIGLGDPTLNLDYSEQFMLSCSEGGCGGWFMDSSAAFLKNIGAPKEDCFPYKAQDVACEGRCPAWESQLEKIPDWNWVSGFPQAVNPTLIKQKLLKGPLLVAMTVYDDFMYYSRGAYEHVQGSIIGDHAIVIIGWDDSDHTWICKNSWGPYWGDSGWFRIKMGKNECGIEESLIYYSAPISWDCDLEEGFENKSGGLPSQWEKKTQNTGYTWKTSTSPVYEGLQSIVVEYDPDLQPQNEVLLSWKVKGHDLSVAFAFMGSYYWGVSQSHYQVSLWAVRGDWDGGTGDDILITENIIEDHLDYDDESWTWIPVSYRLPPEINNTPFRLAFHYQGIDGAQFCLDKVCIQGIQETTMGCACTTDDSGVLDISQGIGLIPIRIQNAPHEVLSFGYDITYDPGMTTYLGFEPGQFFKGFNLCNCQQIRPGQIHCTGSNYGSDRGEKIVPAGYSGTLVTLQFSPVTPRAGKCSLCLENLSDDMEGWKTTNGCILSPPPCAEDMNGDGQVTPKDALCLYEKSLNICPTTFCGTCSEICCDVNMDGECTSADVETLFSKYLGGKINP